MLSEVRNLIWDSNDKRQVEEVKVKYRKAKDAGHRIFDDEGKEVESFNPNLEILKVHPLSLNEDEIFVRILNGDGDDRFFWNMNDPDQIKEVEKKFTDYIKKGWTPFAFSKDGSRKYRIVEFKPHFEEILFEEPKTKEKWAVAKKDFAKKFSNVQVLPKKYKG